MGFEPEVMAGMDVLISRPTTGAAGCAVLLGLHGRASSPEDLIPLCGELGDGVVHVLPRAKDGAWYPRGDGREAGLAGARTSLLALLGAVREQLGTGPELTAVWGFSQGGVLALELGLRAPSALAAAVCLAGKLEGSTLAEPETLRRARGRDFFLVHGVRDAVVPYTLARQAYAALGQNGARVELAELPMGHEVNPLAAGAVRGFLQSALGVRSAPAQA